MMQTDIQSVHINSSGALVPYRTRLKGLLLVGSATGGTLNLWDSNTAPVAATYGRSGYTVTVTSVAHGLSTGQRVGITFTAASGVSATNGNYTITKLTADTFTITDINTGTIATSTVCNYVAATTQSTAWLTSLDTATTTGTPQTIFLNMAGEGMLAEVGIYGTFSNMTGLTVYYG